MYAFQKNNMAMLRFFSNTSSDLLKVLKQKKVYYISNYNRLQRDALALLLSTVTVYKVNERAICTFGVAKPHDTLLTKVQLPPSDYLIFEREM